MATIVTTITQLNDPRELYFKDVENEFPLYIEILRSDNYSQPINTIILCMHINLI